MTAVVILSVLLALSIAFHYAMAAYWRHRVLTQFYNMAEEFLQQEDAKKEDIALLSHLLSLPEGRDSYNFTAQAVRFMLQNKKGKTKKSEDVAESNAFLGRAAFFFFVGSSLYKPYMGMITLYRLGQFLTSDTHPNKVVKQAISRDFVQKRNPEMVGC